MVTGRQACNHTADADSHSRCTVLAGLTVGCGEQEREAPKPGPGTSYELDRNDPKRFAGRDGSAAAKADLAAGWPPKLYMHVFNGFTPGWRIPGLEGCSPAPTDAVGFEGIDELNFSEGSDPLPYNPEAEAFAKSYNQTMFTLRSNAIKQACPEARLK